MVTPECENGRVWSLEHIRERLAGYRARTELSERSAAQAAVAAVFREEAGQAELLFIRRAEHPMDPWSGQMAFPGGRMEEADLTLETAAIRETQEEVGLCLSPVMRLGRLDDIATGHRGLTVSPFVYYHPGPAPELQPNGEVAAAVSLPFPFFCNAENVKVFRPDIATRQGYYPSFLYETNRIWGLTYRMMRSLIVLLGVELPGEEDVDSGQPTTEM